MAVVTEMEQLSPGIPPVAEPPKRPRGRPKKVAQPPVDADEDDTPEVQITGDTDFWMMLSNFTTDEWQQHIAYLYRTGPVIDRKSNGRPVNLCKYSTAFDREDIMKEHGSGGYRIDLCRIDPVSGKSFRVAQERFTIINPKYPPNVPPGDWVEDKANDIWKWGAPKTEGQSAAAAGYPPGFNVSEIMDKADQRALRMVEIMTPKADTSGQNELLIKLIEVATAKPPAPPPPDTSSTDKLLQMLLDDRKQDREEMAKLRDKLLTPVPQKSIIEQFVELRPQIKELVDAFATKAGKTDLWAEIAKEGISQIPDALSLIRDAMKKPEAQQNGQQPRGLAAPAAPASNAPAPAAIDTGKPIAEMTEAEKQAHVDHLWKKWSRRLLDISTKLIEEFTIQDQGYSFRDWYVEMYGKLNWAELRRDLANVDEQGVPHPELVTNMYHAHEQLRRALSPPEKLTAFLVETFTHFGEEKGVTIEDGSGPVEPDEVIPAGKSNEAKTK